MYMAATYGAIVLAVSFRIRLGISSGPGAFLVVSLTRFYRHLWQ